MNEEKRTVKPHKKASQKRFARAVLALLPELDSLRLLGRLSLVMGLFTVFSFGQIVPVKPTVNPPPPSHPSSPARQEDKGEIRIRADYVTVLTTVSNNSNELVRNLTVNDFDIYEDNIPQKIEGFVPEQNTPLRLAVMLDVSSSVRNRLKFEQEAAVRFFREIMRSNDRAAFYYFNHDVTLKQDMTNDLAALETATRGLDAKGGTAIYDAVFLGAQRLSQERGRRIIVLISDGSNTISRTTQVRALDEARRAEAIVYGVYAASETPYDDFFRQSAETAFEALCRQTGGKVFSASTVEGLATSFKQLATELRSQYALAYYSTNDSHDGKFRKIEVRMKQPGLKARARDGYYAPQN